MNPSPLDFIHRFEPGTYLASPTLLLLHGTGGDENDLIDLGRSLWPGANLLSPRGQVNERGMSRFFRRLAEGVFDLDDLKTRTQGLADFIGEAARVYGFNPNRVMAVGYSNGANIAASVLLLRPDTLAGALLFHPMVPLEPDTQPDLTGKPVFIAAGRQDPLVDPALTQRLEELLMAGGANVQTHWQPGGHNLTRDEIQAAKVWLNRQHNTDSQA